MGTWGYGYFEDDAALDFMADIEEAENPKEIIADALEAAIEADYLESDEGSAVIVAATYIDRQINGTRFTGQDEEESLDVDTFPDRNPKVDLSGLRKNAVKALRKVLAEDSELRELWEESEEDYNVWKNGVEELMHRLK